MVVVVGEEEEQKEEAQEGEEEQKEEAQEEEEGQRRSGLGCPAAAADVSWPSYCVWVQGGQRTDLLDLQNLLDLQAGRMCPS